MFPFEFLDTENNENDTCSDTSTISPSCKKIPNKPNIQTISNLEELFGYNLLSSSSSSSSSSGSGSDMVKVITATGESLIVSNWDTLCDNNTEILLSYNDDWQVVRKKKKGRYKNVCRTQRRR